jgi:hypothetical protein
MLVSKIKRDWKVKALFLLKTDRIFSLPSSRRSLEDAPFFAPLSFAAVTWHGKPERGKYKSKS